MQPLTHPQYMTKISQHDLSLIPTPAPSFASPTEKVFTSLAPGERD